MPTLEVLLLLGCLLASSSASGPENPCKGTYVGNAASSLGECGGTIGTTTIRDLGVWGFPGQLQIQTVEGNLTLVSVLGMERLSGVFGSLQKVAGDLTILNSAGMLNGLRVDFPSLTEVGGSFRILDTQLLEFACPELAFVGGSIEIRDRLEKLHRVAAPVSHIFGDLIIENPPLPEGEYSGNLTLEFPALAEIDGSFRLTNIPRVGIQGGLLEECTRIGGDFVVSGLLYLQHTDTLSLAPSLTTVGGDVVLSRLSPQIADLAIAKLVHIGGNLLIEDGTYELFFYPEVTLRKLESIGGHLIVRRTGAYVVFGSLSSIGGDLLLEQLALQPYFDALKTLNGTLIIRDIPSHYNYWLLGNDWSALTSMNGLLIENVPHSVIFEFRAQLRVIQGSFIIRNCAILEEILLHTSDLTVTGDLILQNLPYLGSFSFGTPDGPFRVGGDFTIEDTALGNLNAWGLSQVNGSFNLFKLRPYGGFTLELPSLTSVGGRLSLQDVTFKASAHHHMLSLTHIGQGIFMTNLVGTPEGSGIDMSPFPATTTDAVWINNVHFKDRNCTVIRNFETLVSFWLKSSGHIRDCELPALHTVSGSFTIIVGTLLQTVRLPSLKTARFVQISAGTLLTALDLPSLETGTATSIQLCSSLSTNFAGWALALSGCCGYG